LIAFAGLTLVGACGETTGFSGALTTLRTAWFGTPDQPLSRERIERLPYASISAKIGKGPRVLVVLRKFENQEMHWETADRIILVTRHGRLIKTVGLPDNIRDTELPEDDPLASGLHHAAFPVRFRRQVDLESPRRFSIPIASEFESLGRRRIAILERPYDVWLIRERNVAYGMSWEFANLYWVDSESGMVRKSVQFISRRFDPIDIELLRPLGS